MNSVFWSVMALRGSSGELSLVEKLSAVHPQTIKDVTGRENLPKLKRKLSIGDNTDYLCICSCEK